MDDLKRLANELGVTRLKVAAVASNHQAIEFYRKCGFEDFDLVLEYTFG